MEKPCSATAQKTSMEDLEIIRRMAVRYGDDEIVRVLSKLGRRTGKGKCWSAKRVRWIRCRYSIPGRKTSRHDPEILTLNQATKFCNVSTTVIKRLVSSGVLKKEQVAPWAPWEIKCSDLESKPICVILDRLHKTGKLVIVGNNSSVQQIFFE